MEKLMNNLTRLTTFTGNLYLVITYVNKWG